MTLAAACGVHFRMVGWVCPCQGYCQGVPNQIRRAFESHLALVFAAMLFRTSPPVLKQSPMLVVQGLT